MTQSALSLSTECVRMILKIDDLVISARWVFHMYKYKKIKKKIIFKPSFFVIF